MKAFLRPTFVSASQSSTRPGTAERPGIARAASAVRRFVPTDKTISVKRKKEECIMRFLSLEHRKEARLLIFKRRR